MSDIDVTGAVYKEEVATDVTIGDVTVAERVTVTAGEASLEGSNSNGVDLEVAGGSVEMQTDDNTTVEGELLTGGYQVSLGGDGVYGVSATANAAEVEAKYGGEGDVQADDDVTAGIGLSAGGGAGLLIHHESDVDGDHVPEYGGSFDVGPVSGVLLVEEGQMLDAFETVDELQVAAEEAYDSAAQWTGEAYDETSAYVEETYADASSYVEETYDTMNEAVDDTVGALTEWWES